MKILTIAFTFLSLTLVDLFAQENFHGVSRPGNIGKNIEKTAAILST